VSAELTRWTKPDPPSREELDALFRTEGLSPGWWSNGPHERYAPHSHGYHKVLYCAEGGITFRIEPSGPEIEMSPGYRLDIPPGTSHSAIVGASGVTCVEAPRQSR
jgi:mannose-6-phosphate isomerase-like protein (cupin superfamily)